MFTKNTACLLSIPMPESHIFCSNFLIMKSRAGSVTTVGAQEDILTIKQFVAKIYKSCLLTVLIVYDILQYLVANLNIFMFVRILYKLLERCY